MEIKRTANAGVLLTLDNERILLDGVSKEVLPYLATPPALYQQLLQDRPDALVLTHSHADHYDASFVSKYLQNTAGPVFGPADIPLCTAQSAAVGNIDIMHIPSRHVGKTEPIGHNSYILQGSKCVWFMGDASPLFWKERYDLPRPDVVIAPYAYVMGVGLQIVKELRAKDLVIVHLPNREYDPFSLWAKVDDAMRADMDLNIHILQIGESAEIA